MNKYGQKIKQMKMIYIEYEEDAMIKYVLIFVLLFFSQAQLYVAEIPSSSSDTVSEESAVGWGQWLSGFLPSFGNLYAWIASWRDTRTAEQQEQDNATNSNRFDRQVENIDALATHAEEEHAQARANIAANVNLQETRDRLQRYIASLEGARRSLSLLQVRLSPDYVKEAAEGMVKNFSLIKGFNPLDVYTYLARQFTDLGVVNTELPSEEALAKLSFTQREKAVKERFIEQGKIIQEAFSAEQIYNNINRLINDQEKMGQGNSEETKKLRQVLYLFQDPASKEQFDAFLKGDQQDGLFSLKIEDPTGEKIAQVQALNDRLLIKAELQQDIRDIDKKLKPQ